MKTFQQRILLITVFMACYLVGGVIWWPVPYMQLLNDDGGHLWRATLILPFAAFLTALSVGAQLTTTTLVVASAFPAVVMTRVVLDGIDRPTSHNLFPFEVAIAFFIGLEATLPFAALATLIRWIVERQSASKGQSR